MFSIISTFFGSAFPIKGKADGGNNYVNLLQKAINDEGLDEINFLFFISASESDGERKTVETIASALLKLDLSNEKIQKTETLIHIAGQLLTIFLLKSEEEIISTHSSFLQLLLKFDRDDFFKFIWLVVGNNSYNSHNYVEDGKNSIKFQRIATKWFNRFQSLFVNHYESEHNLSRFIGKFNSKKCLEFFSGKININSNFLIHGFATSNHLFMDSSTGQPEKKIDYNKRQIVTLEEIENYLSKFKNKYDFKDDNSYALVEKFNSPTLYKYIVNRCQAHGNFESPTSIYHLTTSVIFQTNLVIVKWLLGRQFIDRNGNTLLTLSVEHFMGFADGSHDTFPNHLSKPENTQLLSLLIFRASLKKDFELFSKFFSMGKVESLEILTGQYLRNPVAVENLFCNIQQQTNNDTNEEDYRISSVKNNISKISELLIKHCRFPQVIVNYILLSCF